MRNEEGHKKEIMVLGAIFFGLVFAWNIYDYRTSIIGGSEAMAAAGTRTASLSVTVAQSMTLTQVIGDTVTFSTLTPGTKVTGKTGLRVSTNGTGMNITAGRQRANTTPATLASAAVLTNTAYHIDDDAGGLDIFNGISNCATATSESKTWANGTSTGLGFSNYGFTGGSAKSTTCWGSGTTSTDANNQYAALQASASASSIISSNGFATATSIVSVGYALDVTSSQPATSYTGGVVFTATSNP